RGGDHGHRHAVHAVGRKLIQLQIGLREGLGHSGGAMTPESPNPHRDYPQVLGERGLIEPAPRRVRGYFDQALVFGRIRAHYVWEIAHYPQYYIPRSDVRMHHLQDENHVQNVQFGSSRLFSLRSPQRTWPSAARVYDSGPVAGSVRFEW